MSKTADIEKQLGRIQNWALTANKKNILRGLEKLLDGGETVIDIIEGLYRGVKISGDRELAGILCATDRRLMFVTSEFSSPQYEELPVNDIKSIEYERAFSSIIITIKLRSSVITFKTFDNKAAVTKFFAAVNAGGGAIVTRDDSALRILDEVNATMKSLASMNTLLATQQGERIYAAPEADEFTINEKTIDFLFQEAKKIDKTLSELLSQASIEEFKSTLARDIIILSSLCNIANRKLTSEEIMFISLVLVPLNPEGSEEARLLSYKIFSRGTFPPESKNDILEFWGGVSGYIRKLKPDMDLEGYTLKTMNLLNNFDRDHGTKLADRAGSALYTFSQCLMKADGAMDPDEEERLKQIYRLINRGSSASPAGLSVTEPEEEETLEALIKKINALVGMSKIKEQIATLVNLIKVQKEREERKLPVTPLSLHAVFYGPPGTGKTTIARLLGKVYKSMGLLKKGQLVETDRAGLVAGYVGQTAINVDNVVQKALDGVLFIDEAYSLIPDEGGGRDFGQEAVNIILKRMEDHRDRLVVIVAGYTGEMERFINSNPGLRSRFSRYFYFDHYQPEELLQIFDLFCKNVEFKVEIKARDRLLALLATLHGKRDRSFGNGRLVRNIFERIVEMQANRIAGITPLSDELLCTITVEDIPDEKEMGWQGP